MTPERHPHLRGAAVVCEGQYGIQQERKATNKAEKVDKRALMARVLTGGDQNGSR